METVSTEKKAKAPERRSNYLTLRVRRDFAKKFQSELQKINEKKHGRRVRADELLAHLLSFLTNDGRRELQEASMSHSDRFDRDYRAYVTQHGMISKDEYLGKRLSGEVALASSGNSNKSSNQ